MNRFFSVFKAGKRLVLTTAVGAVLLCSLLTACGDTNNASDAGGFTADLGSAQTRYTTISVPTYSTQYTTPTTRYTYTTRTTRTPRPAVQSTRFPNVAQQYVNNIFLQARDYGGCKTLTGNVKLTVVFVNDSQSSWTADAMQKAKSRQATALNQLTTAARTYGANVQFSTVYKTASVNAAPTLDDSAPFAEKVLSGLGLPAVYSLNTTLASQYGVKEAPVIFCINRAGRSFASTGTVNYGEYVVLYSDNNAFMHEFLHLFGAQDYYFPNEVKTIATSLFKKSVMLSTDELAIDAFTAYLIGWTDRLSAQAQSFLQKTNHLTDSSYEEEHEKETYTGQVTRQRQDNGYYTGYLVEGIFHGKGTYEWDNGTVYTGDWVNGKRTGQGTCTFSNGKYVGAFLNDELHGKGTYTWTNGNVYSGDWVSGQRTGQGTFIWKDGTKYVGSFKDGKQHGQGTMTWTNGDVYTGAWVYGERTGQGTYTWANGQTRTGTWEKGVFKG